MADKTDTIKTRLAVEGEKEYREACKSINSGLREISSEMKLVTAQYADNANSTEALTAKCELLSRQRDEERRKIEAAEEALRKLVDNGFKPTDTEYQRMQTRLNEHKTALIGTERAIGDNEKALDELSNSAKDTGKDIKKTGEDVKKASKKAEDSISGWERFGSTMGKVGKAVAASVVAFATAAATAATGLASLTVQAGAYADDILTTATNTRIAAEDLQKYQYALNFIDGDLETLTKTMKKNIQAMDDARNGNAEYSAAYERLGISVTDANGELRDSEAVYWEIIDALGAIANETERDALAMTLLGKSGTEINTIIEAGSEAFKAYGEEAEQMGVVMGDETLNTLGAFDDKVQVLKSSLGGLNNAAGLIALPFLDTLSSEAIPLVASFSTGIQDVAGDVSGMGAVVGEGLSGIINLIAKNLPNFIEMGVNLVVSLISGVSQQIPAIAAVTITIVETLIIGILDIIPLLIDAAAQIIISLASGLGAALPELIPQIVAIVIQIVETLVSNIPLLIDAALALIIGFAQGIVAAIPEIVNAIPKIIGSLIDAVLGSIPLIIQAGIDLLISLVKALPEIISTIVQAIPEIVMSICNAVTDNIPAIIQAGIELFIALVENLPTIIVEIVKAVPQIIKGLVDGFGKGRGKMADVGLNLIKGLWNGIDDAATWLWNKIKGFCNGLLDKIKGFFGIHSPSTVFADIGDNMAAGMGVGFGREMKNVEQNMKSRLGTTVRAMQRIGASMQLASDTESMKAVNQTARRLRAAVSATSRRYPEFKIAASSLGISGRETELTQLCRTYLPALLAKQQQSKIMLDTGTLVGELAEPMDAALGNLQIKKQRGLC